MNTIIISGLIVTHLICYLIGRSTILNRELKKHLPNIKIEKDED